MNTKMKVQIAMVLLMSLVLSVGAGIMVDRFLSMYLSRCVECKKSGVQEDHRRMCPAGHIYYSCNLNQVKQHLYCNPGEAPLNP